MKKYVTAFIFVFSIGLSSQVEKANVETTKSYPLIPFNTNFWNYWDHYWTTWLDSHPKYEAIELTAFDNPKNPDYKLVRVFLSEKAGTKKQYFYLNDSTAVKRSRANTYYSDITYKKLGKKNEPKGLYVEFRDKDNELIKWTINFDDNQKLKKHTKGLTPSIHSVGYVLLYHLRLKTQSTFNDELLINGVDYTFKETALQKEGKRSWYNDGVYSAVVIFGGINFNIKDSIITNNWGREFKPLLENNLIYRSNRLGPENFIEFEVDSFNQIKTYQQKSFNHSFKFSFNPSLPSNLTAKNGQLINYTVSFDDNKKLMNGTIKIEKKDNDIIFYWTNKNPNWAVKRPFQSVLKLNDFGYRLITSETSD